MTRLSVGVSALLVSVLATGWLLGGDEKKPDDPPPKVKGTLPPLWRQLGLSKDQVQTVYTVQTRYNAKIDKLKAEIEALRAEEKAELEKILTKEQKDKLKELKTGEKPKDKDKDGAVKDKDKDKKDKDK